jgi:nitronate monooxygenase
MAGGINTPQLASAVANAGGVGSFGFAYSTPQKIGQDLAATKAMTSGAINANFFVFSPVELPDYSAQLKAMEAIKGLPLGGHDAVSIPQAPFFPDLDAQLEPVWEQRPAILSFHFGIPPGRVIAKAHALGMSVGITATCLKEAVAIQSAGADFIVSQGIEAGGHRGIFEPNANDEQIGAVALAELLAKHCSIPIVAAGGVMSGGDIRAVLAAGARAAQLGTAFLCCDESGTPAVHRDYLLNRQDRGTVFTKGFSGRVARGIENEFIRRMADQPTLPFPIQNTLTATLRQWAGKTGDGEYQSLWAGEAYAKVRPMRAGQLMQLLNAELGSVPNFLPIVEGNSCKSCSGETPADPF